MAFGIGLGLNDGVEKASEFFAGYVTVPVTLYSNLFAQTKCLMYVPTPSK